MRKALALFSFSMLVTSIAFACPDVSGIYRLSNEPQAKGVFWLQQTKCEMLRKSFGTLSEDGKIDFSPNQYYPLDGSAVCSGRSCEYVTASNDAIVWKINYNGSVTVPVHGKCIHTGYSFSKNESGDLKAVFQVKDCADRFQGLAEKIFSRL